MRCRAGDLAIMIQAHHPENLHKLVEVLCRHAHPGRPDPAWKVRSLGAPFVAELDGARWTAETGISLDSALRPLRDGEGVDETLRNLELTQ